MPAILAPPTGLTPRPYQQEAVTALCVAATRGVQRPLLVLPTGTGKIIVFALLVRQRGGRALILAHRDELIHQAVDKLHIVATAYAMAETFAAGIAAEALDGTPPLSVSTYYRGSQKNTGR